MTDKHHHLAATITRVAEDGLRGLDRMMTAPGWDPEFRAIMWGAVERLAFNRKVEAEDEHRAMTNGKSDG